MRELADLPQLDATLAERRLQDLVQLDALQDRSICTQSEPLLSDTARGAFMGSAPTFQQDNKGLDDKQINLGVVQPGEKPAIFSDALRRLANQAKFLHSDLGRYWYSMAASLNRVASDRAGQLEDELVLVTIDQHLSNYFNGIGDRGHFDTVQPAPSSSADVPDEAGGVRAVVLGVKHAQGRPPP